MESLRKIYEKYKDNMYTIAYSLLNDAAMAEDVLHDVFIAFSRRAPKINLYSSLKSYLTTCTVNRCRDMFRKKIYKVVEVDRAQDIPAENNGPEEYAIDGEHADLLTQALNQVPLPQREVIVMHLHGGLKFREIADLQNISISTVQGRYRYGLEKMRQILDGQIEL